MDRSQAAFRFWPGRLHLATWDLLIGVPVVVPEEPALFDFLTEVLLLTAETENLQGLLIQPPDKSKIDDGLWARHRFLPNDIVKLNSATLLLGIHLRHGGNQTRDAEDRS